MRSAQRMDELLERLRRQHPEAVPILRSKYIADCHVGRGRVWRAGRPVVTDTHQLYPPPATTLLPQMYSRMPHQGADQLTWTAR